MNKKLLIIPVLLLIIFTASCNKEKSENAKPDNTESVSPGNMQEDGYGDIISVTPAPDESMTAQEKDAYIFICRDQNNAPVKGVKIQICTDEACMMKESDEKGEIRYVESPYPYDIHVYSVPKGYELVSDKDFKTEAQYETFEISFSLK